MLEKAKIKCGYCAGNFEEGCTECGFQGLIIVYQDKAEKCKSCGGRGKTGPTATEQKDCANCGGTGHLTFYPNKH